MCSSNCSQISYRVMVKNELSFEELQKVIKPILSLNNLNLIKDNLNEIFGLNVKDPGEIINQNQFEITYNNYNIRIVFLYQISTYVSFSMIFNRKLGWYEYLLPHMKILRDLKKICTEHFSIIKLKKFKHVFVKNRIDPGKFITYYHDPRTFNHNWSIGTEISPLLISSHFEKKEHFIQFCFNAECYEKKAESTQLKHDWCQHSNDLSNASFLPAFKNYK